MNENSIKNQEKLAVKIEVAKPEDWPVCKELRLESVTGKDAATFGLTEEELKEEQNPNRDEKWKDETNSDTMFSVLAWNGREPIGLGRAKLADGVWHIRNAYVRENFRGQGIQPKLIAIRLLEIQKRGGTRVVVGVEVGNKRSIKNIKSFGFEEIRIDKTKDRDFHIMGLSDVNDLEVIKKINEVLNAG